MADKIKEIRDVLQSLTPGKLHNFHGNIAVTSENIIGSLTVATAHDLTYAKLFANSVEWITYLIDELGHARRCAEDAWKREDELEGQIDKFEQRLKHASTEYKRFIQKIDNWLQSD